jgi:GTPase SAR1 family protein
MPHINYSAKEISFKIVYYGPAMSGKTTNLINIHRVLSDDIKGEMIMLDTKDERTLFFDFFPVNLGTIQGFTLKFNMYTVPGQVFYEATRRLVLNGADGIVFVADSQLARLNDNLESWKTLVSNLESYGIDIGQLPVVLQYNKRDLDPKIEIGTIEAAFNLNGTPVFQSIATEGVGVIETIRNMAQMTIGRFSAVV